MTGTACEINDVTDNVSYKSHNIDLFSAWLFGKVKKDCFLADISNCGGSVLIPRKQPDPSKSFDLLIMSPENKDEVLTVIQAEQRWADKKFSTEYKKIGVKFKNIDLLNLPAIDSLIETFMQQKNTNVKCYLLNS